MGALHSAPRAHESCAELIAEAGTGVSVTRQSVLNPGEAGRSYFRPLRRPACRRIPLQVRHAAHKILDVLGGLFAVFDASEGVHEFITCAAVDG